MLINYTNYKSAGLSAEAGVINKQQRRIHSWGGGSDGLFLGREVAPGICFSFALAPLLLKLQSIRLRSIRGRAHRSEWPLIHKMWLKKKRGRRLFKSTLAPVLCSFGTNEKLEKLKTGICCLHQIQFTPSTGAQTN